MMGIDYKQLVLGWAEKYFPVASHNVLLNLPVVTSNSSYSGEVVSVALPSWARGLGVDGVIVVPAHCVVRVGSDEWCYTDWFRASFEMLTCQAEWECERVDGPAHSYQYKIPSESHPLFSRAWVNRIFLFLRVWSARQNLCSELELFGARPRGRIHLTHDVDYVDKTFAVRAKQSVFMLLNASRQLLQGKIKSAFVSISRLCKFSFSSADYWQFAKICAIEKNSGVTSQWNFYGGKGGCRRSVVKQLLDPAYSLKQKRLISIVRELFDGGHIIGLHQAFHSWSNASLMGTEKEAVELALGRGIYSCRQHWLRFSLRDTWRAQQEAGFTLDTTLGFNERPGFRNSAALKIPAWDNVNNIAFASLQSLPMVLMDSHLFDYGQMSPTERRSVIDLIVEEIAFTGGEATVIWHQRVFHEDYGWGGDYEYLLQKMVALGVS